jgi:hypothetical protein
MCEDLSFFVVEIFDAVRKNIHSRDAVAAAVCAGHPRTSHPDRMEFVDQTLPDHFIEAFEMIEYTGITVDKIVHDKFVPGIPYRQIWPLSECDIDRRRDNVYPTRILDQKPLHVAAGPRTKLQDGNVVSAVQ